MSLDGCPLLYVFLETSELRVQRELFESALGLDLIEIEPHLPHHRHGVVKYDAGGLILSLNLAGDGMFSPETSDGCTMVFGVPPPWKEVYLPPGLKRLAAQGGDLLTDQHGHHYVFITERTGGKAVLQELRLSIRNLAESVPFYRDVLGLPLIERTESAARFCAGMPGLRLEESAFAVDGGRPNPDAYLIVFHTPRIQETFAALQARGVEFKGSRIASSEIGLTARFEDPSGHRICIYEPSPESLTWGSGPKVVEIAAAGTASR